jgi:hypothetical protein
MANGCPYAFCVEPLQLTLVIRGLLGRSCTTNVALASSKSSSVLARHTYEPPSSNCTSTIFNVF